MQYDRPPWISFAFYGLLALSLVWGAVAWLLGY